MTDNCHIPCPRCGEQMWHTSPYCIRCGRLLQAARTREREVRRLAKREPMRGTTGRRHIDWYAQLPTWCRTGGHWLKGPEDVLPRATSARGRCRRCRNARIARSQARVLKLPLCWVCHAGLATQPCPGFDRICSRCAAEFAELERLYALLWAPRFQSPPPRSYCAAGHWLGGPDGWLLVEWSHADHTPDALPALHIRCRPCRQAEYAAWRRVERRAEKNASTTALRRAA